VIRRQQGGKLVVAVWGSIVRGPCPALHHSISTTMASLVCSLLALSVLPLGALGRDLAAVPVTKVSSTQQLRAALANGDQHIVIKEHLDLTSSQVALLINPGTLSIQVLSLQMRPFREACVQMLMWACCCATPPPCTCAFA
jgi:hypothetical protein